MALFREAATNTARRGYKVKLEGSQLTICVDEEVLQEAWKCTIHINGEDTGKRDGVVILLEDDKPVEVSLRRVKTLRERGYEGDMAKVTFCLVVSRELCSDVWSLPPPGTMAADKMQRDGEYY